MFRRLSEEYGYTYYDAGDAAYDWVDVPHTFSSPMYYVSYGTSALAALDIWTIAREDRQAGIDKYMELTTYGLTTAYCELLEKCGLKSIFEEGTIREIARAVSEYSSALAEEEAEEDASFGGYDGDEAFNNSVWERFNDELTDRDLSGTSLLDRIDDFLEMHMYIMFGAQLLTAVTILIIIKVLSFREKKNR